MLTSRKRMDTSAVPEVVDLCYDSSDDENKSSPIKKRNRDVPEATTASGFVELECKRGKNDDSPRPFLAASAINNEQEAEEESLLLFLKHEDDAVLTIINVPGDGRLCASACNKKVGDRDKQKGQTVIIIATPRLVHIRQPDRWSCGYRNWQMLLCVVIPRLPPGHSFYRCCCWLATEFSREFYQIPSVRDLQVCMERSWSNGFDTDGARHYSRAILGKCSWIGALEVSACLSFLGIDNTVIQFIRCPQSRQELEAFCIKYFTAPSTAVVSSRTRATALLETTSTFKVQENLHPDNGLAKNLPLYLQWEGHSVMAIGVERTTKGNTNLLVLNPSKTGKVVETAIRSKNLSPLRISFVQLRSKDTQVLLPSLYSMSVLEQERLKGKARTLTAAEDHVERAIAHGICTPSAEYR